MTWEIARDRADAVLAEALYWFPVRHHSPSTARFLRDAMSARRPKVIFLEGPADATDLVRFVTSPKTKPPIAIYCSFRDDTNALGLAGVASPAPDIPARFASWYPLLPYSPEYVAMKTANDLGADVIFMDLPHYARVTAPPREGDAEKPIESAVPDAEVETEALIATSAFYRGLADAAGYRTFDEAWDALFEVGARHEDYEAFRRDLTWFCAAARATSDPARMAVDGTRERERYMWRTIREELAKRELAPEQAMVVCGGFHLFLDRDDPEPPPPLPAGTVYNTVAPFSYFRTSELSGYGAGNRAPRYYQTLWECFEKKLGPDEAMVEHVCAVLATGRKAGEALSSADAVSIAQIARMLASLRNRRHPGLDDIKDAILTCCCKGRPSEEGAHLLTAIDDASIGTAVGKVTSELGQLPLVHDFHNQVSDLDLGEVLGRDKKMTVEVDRRTPQGARRSAFFHRLKQVGVPFAELESSPAASGTVFKEKWRAHWSPKIDATLIEKNLYGDSVEAAAVACLEEAIAAERSAAGAVVGSWRRAIDMDLPALALRMEQSCGTAIDEDRRLGSLADALVHLQVLEQHAAFRGLRRDVIHDLVVRCFGRACFAIPDAANVPEEEQPEVMAALTSLAEALLASPGDLDRVLYSTNVNSAAALTTSPFLRGVFVGLLGEIREIPPEELAARVAAYARGRPETLLEAGAFLDGVLAVSRTSLLLGADALAKAIDELLRAAEWDAFVTMLPRMRHAFERLHQRQRESFADRVAALYGLDDGESLTRITTSVGAAVELAALDARVAAIMKEWAF